LAGDEGEALALAWRILVALAEVQGADRFIPVSSAHIDGCLHHGRAGVDFALTMRSRGARVGVPTTLNVGSLDLLHPELYRGDPAVAREARLLMSAYEDMGCEPTWTCAPYQREVRPGVGEQIAWAESNAIVFANSVLGAWTERYGDFTDLCAAVAGRVPRVGLHRKEGRRGTLRVRLDGLPPALLAEEVFYPVLGHWLGGEVGTAVPVLEGLPADVDEDDLKALGAAGASSGSLALFHAVGITPEAPDADAAFQGGEPDATLVPSLDRLRAARDELSTREGGRVAAVSLGTPHFSAREFARLLPLLQGFRPAPGVKVYVSTSREILAALERRGHVRRLEEAGVTLLVDTCTYVTPILEMPMEGVVMTNSAKWAYYAPGNLGVEVAFGSLAECVGSAAAGRVVRDPDLWDG
jgi:predicted aconitase